MLCLFLPYSQVTHLYTYIHSLYFFQCGLSQDTEYSSLHYILGPCCLSILNVIVRIYQPQILTSSLAITSLFSVSVSLFCNAAYLCPILEATYKWYHMVFVILWLALLSMILSRSIYGAPFFWWLSSIPLYICTTSLSIHLSMDS